MDRLPQYSFTERDGLFVPEKRRAQSDMRVTFIHTPMSSVTVAENQEYWKNFDIQYSAAHPNMPEMQPPIMWELPHWMPWLGGVLEEEGFTNLDVVDFYTAGNAMHGPSTIDPDHIRAMLREHGESQVYLFSPMTPNTHLAVAIAEVIKAEYPDGKTVFGGVMATPEHERLAQEEAIDYVVTGRGERALPALLRAIEQQGDMSEVRQLTYMNNMGKLAVNRLAYPPMHPAEIPPDKIELFPPEAGKHIRYLRQVYGLGCPYTCDFCTIQTIGQKPNYFPIQRVLSEMDRYRERFGSNHHFYMGDETFTMFDGPTLELLKALEEKGGITFDAQTRLNRLQSSEVIQALAAGGNVWLEIGLETGDDESGKEYKQHMKLNQVVGKLQQLRDVGIAACAFMVNGLPGQSLDRMKRSTEWAAELIADGLLQGSYLAMVVPYPGSNFYNNPDKYGMDILHRNFALYHEDLPPVFTTEQAPDPEAVHQVYRDGLKALGQAMARPPVIGQTPSPEKLARMGTFWNDTHV